jgi:hypothetical protein
MTADSNIELIRQLETAASDPVPTVRAFASAFLNEYGEMALKVLADIDEHRWKTGRRVQVIQ